MVFLGAPGFESAEAGRSSEGGEDGRSYRRDEESMYHRNGAISGMDSWRPLHARMGMMDTYSIPGRFVRVMGVRRIRQIS
jgi:hypothetical protein